MKRDARAVAHYRGQSRVAVDSVSQDFTSEIVHLGLTLIAFAASLEFTGQSQFFLMLILSVAWAALFFAKNYRHQADNALRCYLLERTICSAWQVALVVCAALFLVPVFGHGMLSAQAAAPYLMQSLLFSVYLVVLWGAECLKTSRL